MATSLTWCLTTVSRRNAAHIALPHALFQLQALEKRAPLKICQTLDRCICPGDKLTRICGCCATQTSVFKISHGKPQSSLSLCLSLQPQSSVKRANAISTWVSWLPIQQLGHTNVQLSRARYNRSARHLDCPQTSRSTANREHTHPNQAQEVFSGSHEYGECDGDRHGACLPGDCQYCIR